MIGSSRSLHPELIRLKDNFGLSFKLMLFVDLPVEVLPLIIQHVLRPSHLVQLCLVNKDFHESTVPVLYERPAIYAWYREAKNRVGILSVPSFTASEVHVQPELRDFPKAISRDSANQLTHLCVSGLANCVNLTSCTWTRDGTLKEDILEALSRCPSLQAIEINGRHAHNYDPELLHRFARLRRISVIMPTAEVVHALPGCFQRNLETLQELTIICKDTKEFAASSSRSLTKLSSITLTAPISGATQSWLSSVEALLFHSSALGKFHLYATGDRVKSIYDLNTGFIRSIADRHRESLTRFAVLRLPMDLSSLDYLVENANRLEELFVTLRRQELLQLGPVVAQSQTLRTLHVTIALDPMTTRATSFASSVGFGRSNAYAIANLARTLPFSPFNLDGDEDDDEEDDEEGSGGLFVERREADSRFAASGQRGTQNPFPNMDELEELAAQFGERLAQFGVQTRIWQIVRNQKEEGMKKEVTS
ncbi:hypothetical protein A7U60_g2264 [Sanghuangporus baumii]|uniref:F-box domain-containing protein n=1 Tax=Sanghuangporus baumii TaxID=108892 RepID=A0A9Q5I313_SANBA|nr:hypothetical protein A7U60_g2264 [Sanghuangporus baumii]